MLKKLSIVLVILVLAIIGLAMTKPNEFKISRSITIHAPVDIVYTQINNFHKWQAWSPWAKLDPQAKTTFEGPDDGVGATMAWDGNNSVGAGKMTITESNPHSVIKMLAAFERPMKTTNEVEFAFQHQNDETTVAWTMTGQANFTSKLMQVFMDMDKLVGRDFEKGLQDIKAISEAAQSATETVNEAPATPATLDEK